MVDGIPIDGRILKALSNSDNGEVGAETYFTYHEDAHAVWAEYSGGAIVRCGMIGLRLPGNALDMRYQHLSRDGKIKTGVCRTRISIGAAAEFFSRS